MPTSFWRLEEEPAFVVPRTQSVPITRVPYDDEILRPGEVTEVIRPIEAAGRV